MYKCTQSKGVFMKSRANILWLIFSFNHHGCENCNYNKNKFIFLITVKIFYVFNNKKIIQWNSERDFEPKILNKNIEFQIDRLAQFNYILICNNKKKEMRKSHCFID